MKRMQKKLREEELRQLRGEMDNVGERRAESSGGKSGVRRGEVEVRGSVEGGLSSSESDMSDDDLSRESRSESEEVSLASSGSNSLIEDDEDGSGSEISGSADFEGDDQYRSEGDDSEDNF